MSNVWGYPWRPYRVAFLATKHENFKGGGFEMVKTKKTEGGD